MVSRKKQPDSSKKSEKQEFHEVPAGEYMCAAQLAFFRERLESEKQALLENAQKTLESIQNTEPGADPNDRASTEEEYLLEFKVRDRERKLLRKIEDALKRIEEGTYGWCEETGEPIGIPRLLARPTASLCIEAQERHEQTDKLYEH